jgi:hypothetical protein
MNKSNNIYSLLGYLIDEMENKKLVLGLAGRADLFVSIFPSSHHEGV